MTHTFFYCWLHVNLSLPLFHFSPWNPFPGPLCTRPSDLFRKRLLNIVEQQRADTRGDDLVAVQVGVDAVAQHGGREAVVAVGNDDGRLGGVEALGPVGDARVERHDVAVGARREGDDQVNLWFSVRKYFRMILRRERRTMILVLGLAARMMPTILVYDAMMSLMLLPWNTSLVPSMNMTMSAGVLFSQPVR